MSSSPCGLRGSFSHVRDSYPSNLPQPSAAPAADCSWDSARDGARPRVATSSKSSSVVVSSQGGRGGWSSELARPLRRRHRGRHGAAGTGLNRPTRLAGTLTTTHRRRAASRTAQHARCEACPTRSCTTSPSRASKACARARSAAAVDRCTKTAARRPPATAATRAAPTKAACSPHCGAAPGTPRRASAASRAAGRSCAPHHKITRVAAEPARGHARLRAGFQAVRLPEIGIIQARQLGIVVMPPLEAVQLHGAFCRVNAARQRNGRSQLAQRMIMSC